MNASKYMIGLLALVLMLAQPPAAAPAMAQKADLSGTYQIDATHTHVGFAVRHLAVSKVRGRFNKLSGTIVYNAADISKSSVEVTIGAASIDTDNEDRDAHLKSDDFLNAEKYPAITFKSTKVRQKGDGLEITGDLTIRDVTRQVTFPFELVTPVKDPWGLIRLGGEARLEIDRQEFGVKFNKLMEAGGLVVGNTVQIELAFEATKS